MDISKVIWILATNALDSAIMRFYEDNKPITPQLMAKKGQEFVVRMWKTLRGAFGVRNDPLFRIYDSRAQLTNFSRRLLLQGLT